MSIFDNKISCLVPRISNVLIISIFVFFIFLPLTLGENITIENITIVQPDKGADSWTGSIIPLLGVLLGGIITLATSVFLGRQKDASALKAKQQQLYCKLFGLKFLLAQVYVSLNQNYIYHRSHKIAKDQSWCENKEYESSEIERHKMEYNELVMEVARINQKVFETLGIIPILFKQTSKFDPLIEKLKKLDEGFKGLRNELETDLEKSCSSANTIEKASLDSWKGRSLEKVNKLTKDNIEATMDKVLSELSNKISGKKSD